MTHNYIMIIILSIYTIYTPHITLTQEQENEPERYEWAIIGAGVAGITALAVLLDSGVSPSSVAWIDPEFNVGRMGKYYRNVPGNVQAHRLILYVDLCPYFKKINPACFDTLYSCDPEEFQPLHVIVDPLISFTRHLASQVTPITDTITAINKNNGYWYLTGTDTMICAKKVILAIGAYPRQLDYNIPIIPLDDALDKQKLGTHLNSSDSIALFGSMHSAILVLKYLSEYSLKRIVNFYSNPYFYGVPGLEGATALWAQTVLEQNKPDNIIRLPNTTENRNKELPSCTKVIYAIGFKANSIMVNGTTDLSFDEETGIIDNNLYGIGIAFPPTGIFHGQKIAKNGLHTYLAYAKKFIPQWIRQEKSYNQGQSLFISNHSEEFPWI